ncbi:MAG: murein biosynthesis integral membrane protein MurJ [Treponema sp.]|nr:murein biosynthesis integral membrane protein MurJ [Treponema sp.]
MQENDKILQDKRVLQKKSSLIKSGISLSFLTLISRILGLAREMTKAAFLGTSNLADAFGIAFMIPNLFRRLFAENSISVAFVPTFKKYLESENIIVDKTEKQNSTQDFLNSSFTLVSFLVTCFVSLGMLFSPWIVKLFANSDAVETLTEMNLLTKIMFPYLLFVSLAAFFQGILNGHKIFSPSGFTPILFNLCVIIGTYVLMPFCANPARAMAIGVTVGGSIQAIFQLPFVLKQGWKIKFTSLKNAFTNKGTKRVLALIGPTIIGMACYQLNDVVSTALAGRAGVGVVSSLQYSLRLQELILGIFAVSIGTVILPDLSGLAAKKNWSSFNKMLIQAIKIIALITIPVTFFSFCYGENLIILIYKTNRFTDESVASTLAVFIWHIAGLFFIALNRIVAPAFYAQGNTKLPTLAGIIGFAVNIILASALVGSFSGTGIAFALSAASFANTVALFAFMKKTGTIEVFKVVKSSVIYSIKMIIFSLIACVPVYFLRPFLLSWFAGHNRFISQGVPLTIAVIIFATLGIIFLTLTRDDIIFSIISKLKRKISGKN